MELTAYFDVVDFELNSKIDTDDILNFVNNSVKFQDYYTFQHTKVCALFIKIFKIYHHLPP